MSNSLHRPVLLRTQDFDGFPDLLFLVSRDGVILDFRGGRQTPLYAAPDTFLGRPLDTVLPEPVAAKLESAVARVAANRGLEAVDYTLPFPDGEHNFEARLIPLTTESVLAVCRDLTDRPTRSESPEGAAWNRRVGLRNPRTPHADAESVRRLAESVDQVLWLRDAADGRVLYVSPGFLSVFGRDATELYADPRLWMQAVHPDDRDYAGARYDAWFSGRTRTSASLTYRVVRPDGTSRWLLDTVTVSGDHGPIRQIGGVARDVTTHRGLVQALNDALAVIVGETQVALRLPAGGRSQFDCLDRVLAASRTAEALIRRIPTYESRVAHGPAPDEVADRIRAATPPDAFESARDEWRLIVDTRPNVLLEGPVAATEAALHTLLVHSRSPVVDWSDTIGDARPGTLVVRNVGALSPAEQRRLLQWLEAGERAQVISLSDRSVYALVSRGAFSEDLFYRLNVIRLDV